MVSIKKVLIASLVICSFSLGINQIEAKNVANSDSGAPIEVHPARTQNMNAFNQTLESTSKHALPPKSAINGTKETKATATAGTKKNVTAKRHRKLRKIVPIKVAINYQQIDKLIENNNFDDAQRIINVALKQNSKDVKAQILQTVSYAKQNKLDLAQSQINKLSKTNPKNSDLHYAQGLVYYKRTASSNMVYINNTQKLLQEAQSEFNSAITLDKTNSKAYNAAGVIALNLGQNTVAKDFFKKACAADKTSSTAIDNLGTMDFIDSKYNDAEKKFKQALSLNSQNSTAMYHLAQVATVKQEFPKALMYLTTALSITPNCPSFYNLMGEVYQNQGNEAAAINSFKKAISLKPEFTQPYFNLAEIYEKRGDSEFAIEQLRTVVSIDPNASAAKLRIADISLATGKYNQAIETYASLVGVNNYNDLALKGLADSYYEKAQLSASRGIIGSTKDVFKAADYINKAIEANNATNMPNLELHLAKLKLAKITNQPKLSDAALDEIVKSPDNSLPATIIKGEAYLTLNNIAEAKKMFDIATASTNATQDNFQDDLSLAEIFIYHKQYENADGILQNVLKQDSQNKQALSDVDYIQKCQENAKKYLQTADFYMKANNINLTIDALSTSLAYNPNNAQAHLLLAQLYEKQKDYKSAILNYRIYLNLSPNAFNKNKIEKEIQKLERKQL